MNASVRRAVKTSETAIVRQRTQPKTKAQPEVVLYLSKEEFRHLIDVLIFAPILLTADPGVEMALYEAIGIVRHRLGM